MNILKKILCLIGLLLLGLLIYMIKIQTASLTSKSFFINNTYCQAKGTWKAQNFEQGVYYSTKIKCYKSKKECIVASTDIDLTTKLRPIEINIYNISKWDDNEIIAQTDDLKFPQKLIINKKLQTAQTIMYLDNNKNRTMTLEGASLLKYNAWSNEYKIYWNSN